MCMHSYELKTQCRSSAKYAGLQCNSVNYYRHVIRHNVMCPILISSCPNVNALAHFWSREIHVVREDIFSDVVHYKFNTALVLTTTCIQDLFCQIQYFMSIILKILSCLGVWWFYSGWWVWSFEVSAVKCARQCLAHFTKKGTTKAQNGQQNWYCVSHHCRGCLDVWTFCYMESIAWCPLHLKKKEHIPLSIFYYYFFQYQTNLEVVWNQNRCMLLVRWLINLRKLTI